jgi:hypothetical protein
MGRRKERCLERPPGSRGCRVCGVNSVEIIVNRRVHSWGDTSFGMETMSVMNIWGSYFPGKIRLHPPARGNR